MMGPIIGLESIRPKAEQETKPMLGYTSTQMNLTEEQKNKVLSVSQNLLIGTSF